MRRFLLGVFLGGSGFSEDNEDNEDSAVDALALLALMVLLEPRGCRASAQDVPQEVVEEEEEVVRSLTSDGLRFRRHGVTCGA